MSADSFTIVDWPIDKPKPYPANARVITVNAVDIVARSLEKFGWRQPIVVDQAGVIVAGHTRLKAAIKLGYATVPVHVIDDMTQEQIDAYRLMDNRANQESSWDNDLVAEELAELRAKGYDLGDTGFSPSEVATHLEGLGGGDVDAVTKETGPPTADKPGPPPAGSLTCPRCRKHFIPE